MYNKLKQLQKKDINIFRHFITELSFNQVKRKNLLF